MSSFFDSAKHAVHGAFVNAAGNLRPTLTETKFIEKGVLTPDEFVEAGDHLTIKFPTWSWETASEDKRVSYLPDGKQYLCTRNVPVIQTGEESGAVRTVNADVEDDDGWATMEVAGSSSTGGDDDGVVEVHSEPAAASEPAAEASESDSDSDSDVPDMEEFEEENIEEADDSATLDANTIDDNVVKTRTYDLFISYDNYYQTPRLWLSGYDENKRPLPPTEVFKDISSDHAHKTVTIDKFGPIGTQCANIHPCRHAETMLRMIGRTLEAGREPRVDQYLVMFLKMMSAVINIEYDYTMATE